MAPYQDKQILNFYESLVRQSIRLGSNKYMPQMESLRARFPDLSKAMLELEKNILKGIK